MSVGIRAETYATALLKLSYVSHVDGIAPAVTILYQKKQEKKKQEKKTKLN